MSVTTVLIPVPEQVAETLVAGGPLTTAATASLIEEATPLRRLVATVDAVREELHACLYHHWAAGRPPSAAWLRAVVGLFRRRHPILDTQGYDPFVHLFGRSLPIDGPSPRHVAESLRALLSEPPERGLATLADMIGQLDRRAAAVLRQQCVALPSATLSGQLSRLASAVAVDADVESSLNRSIEQLARLLSLTQPLWRLDGHTLPSILSAVGIEEQPGSPAPLYEELSLEQPALAPCMAALDSDLITHEGTGAFLSSSDVTRCLGAIRLRRATVMANAARAATPLITLRHLRLLEEALCYCELTGKGLLETSGLEETSASATI